MPVPHPGPATGNKSPRGRRGCLIFFLVSVCLGFFSVGLLAITSIFLAFGPAEPARVTKSSALHLKISGVIQEHQPPAPFEFLLQPSFHLHDYIALIEKARLDPKIEGIFLEIGLSNLGWAQAEDLRDALMAFRSHGKWLVAYGEVWEEREFFLATTADEIYMPPGAHLALDGFAYRATFYSDLLTKYGVNIDVMAFGEYKSMADSFQKNAMPEPVREATLALLRSQEKV